MQIYRTTNPPLLAEGRCVGLPYDTEIAGSDGVRIHFWVRPNPVTGAIDLDHLQRALREARNARDITYASYSVGEPEKFWAHEDIGTVLTP